MSNILSNNIFVKQKGLFVFEAPSFSFKIGDEDLKKKFSGSIELKICNA